MYNLAPPNKVVQDQFDSARSLIYISMLGKLTKVAGMDSAGSTSCYYGKFELYTADGEETEGSEKASVSQ